MGVHFEHVRRTAGRLYWQEATEMPTDCSTSVNTREKLAADDPGLFALVNETMAYENKVDWRCQPGRGGQ